MKGIFVGLLVTALLTVSFMSPLDMSARVDIRGEGGDFETASASAGSWPMFRYDPCRSGYSPSTGPTRNDTIWTYGTGGPVSSSPAVVDDEVFVGSYDGYLYCLDGLSGSQTWNASVGEVGSSPAVVDDRVYVGSYGIYCLNRSSGAVIWSFGGGQYVWASPSVASGKVYVGAFDDKVYCLDAVTGGVAWNFTTGDDIISSPAVSEGYVYVGSNDDRLYCLDASSGTLIWSFTTGGDIRASPAVAMGQVFVGSLDGSFYCLDALNGTVVWASAPGTSFRSSAAIAYGRVYAGSDDDRLYCWDAVSGVCLWSFATGNDVRSSPAVAGGMVYVGSYDNKIYCLNASSGLCIWSFATASSVYSSVAIGLGRLYVGSGDGYVYALGPFDWWPMVRHDLSHTGQSTSWAPPTNQTLWKYATGGAVRSSPAVVDDTVFVGSDDGKVYALDYLTGEMRWSYTTGGAVGSSPAVAYGMVYVGSNDHNVYALRATTGALVWSFSTEDVVSSSPAVVNGMVYVGSEDHRVYALDYLTGALEWSYLTGDGVLSSPAVADGKVYVGSFDARVYALDASTGAHVWDYATGQGVVSSPVFSSEYGLVYVGSMDGKVYALDASTGEERWSRFVWDGVYSSPAFSFDYGHSMVYVGSMDGKVYALDAFTGDVVWSEAVGNYTVTSSPAVAWGKVYVGACDWTGKYGTMIGKVHALDATTGAHIWNYTTGSNLLLPHSSPAVAFGKVYVGGIDAKVYAFGIPVLSAWTYSTPTIDGRMTLVTILEPNRVIQRPEWGDAAEADFTFFTDGSESLPATVYVMNDDINLYMALAIRSEDFDADDCVVFTFDNNHNGRMNPRENCLTIVAGHGGMYEDGFIGSGTYTDQEAGGTRDGVANAYYNVEDATWNLELAFPLDSSDSNHDFSLAVGSFVGFAVDYFDAGGLEGWSVWPSPTFEGMATIQVAGPPSAPTPSNIDLSITGIEVTQAIQTLTNALPLVAGKATAVRVYVSIGPFFTNIGADVYLYGYNSVGEPLGVLSEHAFPSPNPTRAREADSANFLLPMDWTSGPFLVLKAFVKDSSFSRSETDYNNNWFGEQSFSFEYQVEPRVYIVPINRGTAKNPDLPTTAQIADAESYFRTIFPVSTVRFCVTTPIMADGASEEELMRACEAIYFFWTLWGAWVPQPLDQIVGMHTGTGGVAGPTYADCFGWASSVGCGMVDIMAHEINHNWGPFTWNNKPTNGWGWGGHVGFGPGAPTDYIDLSWPSPNGLIQEVGFDTRTMSAIDAATTFDFMTYAAPNGQPVWISPYRWNGAFNLLRPSSRTDVLDGGVGLLQQEGESLVISGRVSANGTGSLDPIFRLPGTIQSNPTSGSYALVLQDSVGTSLSTRYFQPSGAVDSEQDDPYYFFMTLPYVSGIARVLLTYENVTVLDEIVVSQHAPTVTILAPNGGEHLESGVGNITWTASDLDGDPLAYQVFYSTDNGTTWQLLALSLTRTYLEVDWSLIPGSLNAVFRVVASDGFNTGEDRSDGVFTVADKPPCALILRPDNDAQVLMNEVVLLEGYGTDVDDALLPETAYTWTSSRDGLLGTGTMLTTLLTPGTHAITLTVRDSQGHYTSDTVTVTVTPDFEFSSVAASKTALGQGFSAAVNVTIANRSPIPHTVDVTVFVNKTASADQWSLFGGLGDVNRDGSINQADVNLLELWWGSTVPPAPSECDLNGDGVVGLLDLTIIANNMGLDIWTYFGLSSTFLGMQTILLPVGGSETVTAAWNTTDLALGNYTLWAYATPGEFETGTTDILCIGDVVLVTIPGDVDGDRDVDIFDIVRLAGAYGTQPPNPKYNPNCDINDNGVINIFDVVIAAGHYGDSW